MMYLITLKDENDFIPHELVIRCNMNTKKERNA